MAKYAGLKIQHRNRRTRSIVSVYDASEAGMGDSSKYVVVCEHHGTLVDMDTLKKAAYHMTAPEGFCEGCRKALATPIPRFREGEVVQYWDWNGVDQYLPVDVEVLQQERRVLVRWNGQRKWVEPTSLRRFDE